jgi:hypothetical protein
LLLCYKLLNWQRIWRVVVAKLGSTNKILTLKLNDIFYKPNIRHSAKLTLRLLGIAIVWWRRQHRSNTVFLPNNLRSSQIYHYNPTKINLNISQAPPLVREMAAIRLYPEENDMIQEYMRDHIICDIIRSRIFVSDNFKSFCDDFDCRRCTVLL